MSFASMRVWIAARHWGWQIPLFVGYALLWLAWQTLGVLYAFFMVVLGSFFGRGLAPRQRTAWGIWTSLGIVIALFAGLALLAAYQMLGQALFIAALLLFLYWGGRMVILGRL